MRTSELLRLPIKDREYGFYEVAATVRPGTDQSGKLPPILFISGLGIGQGAWKDVGGAFPEHTVITYDRAGLGDSDARPHAEEPRNYSDMASEAEQVVRGVYKNRPFTPPVICAHSLGGLIARLYADNYRVSGLVLVESAHDIVLKHGHAALGFNNGNIPDSPLIEKPGVQHSPDCTWFDAHAGAQELASIENSQAPTLTLARSPRWYWRIGVDEAQTRERLLQIPSKHSNAYLKFQHNLARSQDYRRYLEDGRQWTVHQLALAHRLNSPYVGATVKEDGAPVGHKIHVEHPAMVVQGVKLVLAAVEGKQSAISDRAAQQAFRDDSELNCVVILRDQLKETLSNVPAEMQRRIQRGEQLDVLEWEDVKMRLTPYPPFTTSDPQEGRLPVRRAGSASPLGRICGGEPALPPWASGLPPYISRPTGPKRY